MPKINLDNPPDWLICPCYRCISIRISISGRPVIPVCNQCGEILIIKKEGLPSVMEDCPNCNTNLNLGAKNDRNSNDTLLLGL